MGSTLSNKNISRTIQDAIVRSVSIALEEDIGDGDLTAQLIPALQTARATIISREAAILCGIPWVESCFQQVALETEIQWRVAEGERIQPNQILCEISGNARAMLTAERSALNFLQTLCATATLTRRYVDAIAGTNAQILDTRKTLPGMRLAQKYAVALGGGMNQRLGLYDGILIKENHIAAAGSIEAALKAAHAIGAGKLGQRVSIQIEVETLSQLQTALEAGATLILLDNFSLQGIREAVSLNAGRAILEASGNINLDNVRDVALTGVDRISIGSLTKNVQAVDLSMRFAAMHFEKSSQASI
ncbi:MAG: carboxylating nicotinate-nucleotide diphosphorylase [Methylophilaceae bacterium]